jgi:prepilin-type processing-associated H-X9-DG protein
MNYEYSRWIDKNWSPDTAKLGTLGRRAVVYDFFALSFGRFSHRTAYNVLYGDGSVKAYRDRNGAIMRRAIDMPAGLPDAMAVLDAFNNAPTVPPAWLK